MAKLIECIPNFSEGRDPEIIALLVQTARSTPGVTLLDYSSDQSHNRSVFTLVGDPDAVLEAAFQLCRCAAAHIDLTQHSGEHPRMGATDVIPLVPVKEVTVEECVALSKQLAARIWDELAIPVFLYEDSATNEARRNLAAVRKGQFEGMPDKLLLPEWAPDFGERKVHPTAGITAVGARKPLIAFNVNLSTADVAVANAIAKTIRGSSGGYVACKAMGVYLEDRGIAQVSMNMVDYEKTPLYRVFEAIRFEATRYGVTITGSELIGLAPAKAIVDCAEYYLKLEAFRYDDMILDNHLLGSFTAKK